MALGLREALLWEPDLCHFVTAGLRSKSFET